MAASELTWSGSLHQTFRLLPRDRQSGNLKPFLEAEGLSPTDLLEKLPYDRARAKDQTKDAPDAKRYRDGKQVYQTVGLLYEDDGVVHVTDLGVATRRWLDIVTPKNRVILARHAAYALAACQLRNPTGAGKKYAETVDVFPFAFIWRAMLALDWRINSDELNRGLFKVRNADQLQQVGDQLAGCEAQLAAAERELANLDALEVEVAWVARCLTDFGGIWDVLTPENRGRLMRAVIQRVEVNEPANQVSVFLADLGADVPAEAAPSPTQPGVSP